MKAVLILLLVAVAMMSIASAQRGGVDSAFGRPSVGGNNVGGGVDSAFGRPSVGGNNVVGGGQVIDPGFGRPSVGGNNRPSQGPQRYPNPQARGGK